MPLIKSVKVLTTVTVYCNSNFDFLLCLCGNLRIFIMSDVIFWYRLGMTLGLKAVHFFVYVY